VLKKLWELTLNERNHHLPESIVDALKVAMQTAVDTQNYQRDPTLLEQPGACSRDACAIRFWWRIS
jgi:hypothetical protein